MYKSEEFIINLPYSLAFTYHGTYDFNRVLSIFDWKLKNQDVLIDFSQCLRANYQALSLFVLYVWHLRTNGCKVKFYYDNVDKWQSKGASKMWRMMGANGLFYVFESPEDNFISHNSKPLFAIRNSLDFRTALEKAESYTHGFDVEYEKTLRYVLSELLYNTLEHGHNPDIPSIIQFSWYREKDEISFIIADLGIGIKKHLRQVYPEIDDNVSAIKKALKPQVSGTFFKNNPYQAKNNAGIGLYISSNIIRKLHADMHIVSGDGVVHISPTDVTGRKIESYWPGTLVYVTIKLGISQDINLQRMMSEFRSAATQELSEASNIEAKTNFYINVRNYFGKYAEDKMTAIRIRDEKLMPAIAEGKSLTIDFDDIISAPHSFLNALLATPIRQYGMAAYKKIKIINAAPEIRETIDFIMDENTNIGE
ncbi:MULTISPECIES: STAS-like domain-containing protein [Calothrix]|uniref:DUF4325 domain-containing protein n=2 Tax=Calothrix TaxID=1186 RepID=A0ABR8AGY1_9CYAN|nr:MULTISPECIES: DUF4325 domain-containing protein [Calothrix]MBD2198563.1 DUF4325 domain-containing protein [Calothrix parietina FACHB-288]MBD2226982.1 DUF4325 domain-containing protein [Calothrix anomala FACHB-343]